MLNVPFVPQKPKSGIYRVKLLSVTQNNDAYVLRYDISIGPCVGWATYMYQQCGKWPLTWRLDKRHGSIVIKCALDAINSSAHKTISKLEHAIDKNLCLKLNVNSQYIDVQKSYPANYLQILPQDIQIGTTGGWAKGSPNCHHATLLAAYSGLPYLFADVHETKSPMIEWCAAHNIIIVPRHFAIGDYATSHSSIIVDRKSSILELYQDFLYPHNRRRYEDAAISTQAEGKSLVYIVAIGISDKIQNISDLKHWSATVNGKTYSGAQLSNHLLRYSCLFRNVSFLFVPSNMLCATIWNTIC